MPTPSRSRRRSTRPGWADARRTRPELRRVEPIMGTTVSIEVRAAARRPSACSTTCLEQLRDVEARFSTYRPDSEISRLGRGELREEDCSLDVRHVLTACDHLAAAHRRRVLRPRHRRRRVAPRSVRLRQGLGDRGGRLAARQRRRAATTGSMPVATSSRAARPAPGPAVARRDPPSRPGRPRRGRARGLRPGRGDVGHYERGAHIADPRTGLGPPSGLRSVTVVGPGLAFTDAYATAVYVDGSRWPRLARRAAADYAALAITDDGRTVWTDGMDRYLVREG